MRTIILGLGLAAALATVAMTAPAAADWQRQGQTTGPRGKTVQSESRGSCNNGQCNWTRESEGPRGKQCHDERLGDAQRAGQWSGSSTTTGSGGQTVKREGSFQVVR